MPERAKERFLCCQTLPEGGFIGAKWCQKCGMWHAVVNERGCELVGCGGMVRYREDEGLCEENGEMWNMR